MFIERIHPDFSVCPRVNPTRINAEVKHTETNDAVSLDPEDFEQRDHKQAARDNQKAENEETGLPQGAQKPLPEQPKKGAGLDICA